MRHTVKVYFIRLLNDAFYVLIDYSVTWMYGFDQREYCKLMANVN